VNLARRNFPDGLEPPLAGLPGQHGIEDRFHQRLTEAIRSGIDKRIALPGSAVAVSVERITFANGTQAVHKTVHAEMEVHAEVLSSLVGHAIGARVPTVYQAGRREMYMELMPGYAAVDILTELDEIRPYTETWDGLLLGALDAVIDNRDRHIGNWIIADDDTIAGIDHTAALCDAGRPGPVPGTTEPGQGALTSPFARRWFVQSDDYGRPEWKDNVLHPADIDVWLPNVLALQPHFKQRGYPDEWLAVVGRLRAIRSHAKGPQPWLTARIPLNSLSPEPTVRSSPPSRSPRTPR
jgi:hypothetical protein